ncbi:MAG: response regulator [Hyphomicrobiaceae bacterium]
MASILLADDDKGTLELVRRALELDGHRVTTAEDGSEALALLEAGTFALLVADVEMPGLDGIELARRARQRLPAIRLVLMSGYAEGLEKARNLAGVRLVSKPFGIDQMRAEARAALA